MVKYFEVNEVKKIINTSGLTRITGAEHSSKISGNEWNNLMDYVETMETKVKRLERILLKRK